jgi:hypothetical protein
MFRSWNIKTFELDYRQGKETEYAPQDSHRTRQNQLQQKVFHSDLCSTTLMTFDQQQQQRQQQHEKPIRRSMSWCLGIVRPIFRKASILLE